MNDDRKQDFKKSFPGGFVWFLMAAFILALMVQNFIDTKFANISFNYQLEHLVNLQLIQSEYSKKIALNDNLVTFSGKFRDQLTEEGKSRFKYLELLNTNHHLLSEKIRIDTELTALQGKIIDSSDLFLHLSGISVPKGGYIIVDDIFTNIDEKDHSVILTSLTTRPTISLPELKNEYSLVTAAPNQKNVSQFGASLMEVIRHFRSPALGIGSESVKHVLRNIEKEVSNANSSNTSVALRLAVYHITYSFST